MPFFALICLSKKAPRSKKVFNKKNSLLRFSEKNQIVRKNRS